MKKLYSTQNWAKAVSLGTAMAALLSSVSPVFAANLAIRAGLLRVQVLPVYRINLVVMAVLFLLVMMTFVVWIMLLVVGVSNRRVLIIK
ncbi:hypothetical protein [Bartonella henselae]|uniref:hypothetical protein n=1 Tax=Bartonella henselae TaxID=38323 RepID=UPI000A5C531A